MKEILIVEDDTTLNKMLSNILAVEGYNVTSAYTVKEVQYCFRSNAFQLVILDINLPDGSGFDVCKEIRKKSQTAVIFLTANDLEQDMIKGYEVGAADYITKPFPNQILRLKVKAILDILERTETGPPHKVYDDGHLKIDFSSIQAYLNGKEIVFSPLEYRMLQIFIQNKGILLTRQKLLEHLWDSQENYVDEHTLTATVSRVRGKIEQDGSKYIQTVYGMGYMFTGGGMK
ncbi:MAG: response regulator transcription factor [Eubacteriales bacterium]|nr:response regulator transcription factor [Eubacteriales bacterium]